MVHKKPTLTSLLRASRNGDALALERVRPLVYQELRNLAALHSLYAHRPPLQPAELARELFFKLRSTEGMEAGDRIAFFAVAAQSIRWILRDMAKHSREKKVHVVFEADAPVPETDTGHLADLFQKLESKSREQARVAELRLLVGLSNDEIAGELKLPEETVEADWRKARAWMEAQLAKDKAAA